MYIKGITDYSKQGEARETGHFAGICTQDGELRESKNGKQYGTVSVRAFNRKDGTAAFMTIKSFHDDLSRVISSLKKGDRILAWGSIATDNYNGKQRTDMFADFLIPFELILALFEQGINRAALEGRMDAAGFDNGKGGNDFQDLGDDDGELPF